MLQFITENQGFIVIVLLIVIANCITKYFMNNEEKKNQNFQAYKQKIDDLVIDFQQIRDNIFQISDDVQGVYMSKTNAIRTSNLFKDADSCMHIIYDNIQDMYQKENSKTYEETSIQIRKLRHIYSELLNIKRTSFTEEQMNYYKQHEDKKRQSYCSSNRTTKKTSYFADCKTKSERTKRYRELAKQFHPDSPNGNAELFQAITEEYKSLG